MDSDLAIRLLTDMLLSAAKMSAPILLATLVVAVSALTVGALLFPLGELTTISGTRISFTEGLGRALLIALVVAASLTGVAALGLFVSTLTNSGIAAMASSFACRLVFALRCSSPSAAVAA